MGALYGAVDYLSAIAISYNKQTIMKMVSFTAKDFSTKTTVKTEYIDPAGGKTETTTEIVAYHSLFKNFLGLDEVLTIWPDLFWAQNLLQASLPYAYIFMLEVTVLAVFLTSFVVWMY